MSLVSSAEMFEMNQKKAEILCRSRAWFRGCQERFWPARKDGFTKLRTAISTDDAKGSSDPL